MTPGRWVRLRDRIRGLARQLRGLLRPGEAERRLDEEMDFHLEMETERLVREGHSPDEARRRARVAFGGVERHQQRVREARWTWSVSEGLRDGRFALRALVRRPVFALMAVGTVAVAIGVAATFFSVVDAVLLRPLPVPDPHRLVQAEILTRSGGRWSIVSLPDYRDYRDQATGAVELAGQHVSDITLARDGPARASLGLAVSGSWFGVMGLRPAVGRFFEGPAADRPEAPLEAVLAHHVWVSRFGADPSILGGTIRVNGHRLTVIGVAPGEFEGPMLGARPALYYPLGLQERLQSEGMEGRTSTQWVHLLGRLAPGATPDQAAATLGLVARRLAAAYEYPEMVEPAEVAVKPLSTLPPRVRETAGRATLILLAASVTLLLIAVVNVAGMLLARASRRGRELAVRRALGAGRLRITRQLLVEGLVLAVLAGALGTGLAVAGSRLIEGVEPPGAAGFHLDLRMDPAVLAFTLLAALLASLVFGLIPAYQAYRSDVAGAMRRGSDGRGVSRVRSVLVGGQVALTLVLLFTTALLLRTLQASVAVDHGFDAEGLVLAEMDLGLAAYDEARGRAFYASLLERLRASPAVASAALSTSYPLSGSWDQTRVAVAGTEPPDSSGWIMGWNAVSEGYFETLGLPLQAGSAPDPRTPPLKIVVNRATADLFWEGEGAVGRRVGFGRESGEVTGVAPTGRYRSLSEEPRLFAWVPLSYEYSPALYVHIRPRGDRAGAIEALRSTVASLDPDVPLIQVTTLERAMGQSMFFQRLAAGLIGGFAALGLLLSLTGILGLLAFTVEQRRREIGIRIALGAPGREVVRSTVLKGLRPVLVGLALGGGAALVVAQAVESLLYGVAPRDPLSLSAAVALLLLVAGVAAWVPARRAVAVDPAAVLKVD